MCYITVTFHFVGMQILNKRCRYPLTTQLTLIILSGVPAESGGSEKRVALSPAASAALIKKGMGVNVERGAGISAQFLDSAYEEVGAKIVDKEAAWGSGLSDNDLIIRFK